MGKPRAPDPPDYAAAAQAQGEANLNSALATGYLNQQNQVTPYGSLTYSYEGQGHQLPDGTWVPQATVTTTLSPEQQVLYDQQNQLAQSLNNIAIQGLDYVGNTALTPTSLEGLPANGVAPNVSPMQTGFGPGNFALGQYGNNPDLATSYDFSEASQLPQYSDFNASRDQITDAYMQRLQPYIDRDRAAMENRLSNQGIGLGSEAYETESDIFNRGVNDQRIAALLAGDRLQQNLFNNSLNLRRQGINEAMAQGQFGNNALQNMWQMGLANQGFNNDVANQEFGQRLSLANLNNEALSTMFNQGLAGANFNQQARQQALQEADYLRNQPLNMLNALRSGNQVTPPQFANTAAGAVVQAAPVYQATADQYAAALNRYNTQLQGWGAGLGGLAGLGASFI